MDVSVILVSYNTKNLTRNCLNSILNRTQGIEYDIYVIDNNSQDGSVEMIETEFPQVNLIKNVDNKGFGVANNIAIQKSCAKYVFCLNTDTILMNNAIKMFFDYMEYNPKVGACGGNLYDKDMNLTSSYGHSPCLLQLLFNFFKLNKVFKNFYNNNLSSTISKKIIQPTKVDYISGADLFLRKSLLNSIGIFDENIFMYYEDTDLCLRIKKSLHDIIVIPDTKIIHLESKSTDNMLKKILISKKSEFYYFTKHKNYLCAFLTFLHTKIKYKESVI